MANAAAAAAASDGGGRPDGRTRSFSLFLLLPTRNHLAIASLSNDYSRADIIIDYHSKGGEGEGDKIGASGHEGAKIKAKLKFKWHRVAGI